MLNPCTLPSSPRDFPEWHHGRGEYAVWALDLAPWLAAECRALREHFDDLLLPGYVRQPHLTLRVCGFPAPVRRYDDDYLSEQYERDRAGLVRGAPGPFSIEVGALGTFETALFLSVRDFGGIARLHRALSLPGTDGFFALPHVTIGLYRVAVPLDEVRRRLARVAVVPRTLEIRGVSLMTYQPSVIGGPLTTKEFVGFSLEGVADQEGEDAGHGGVAHGPG